MADGPAEDPSAIDDRALGVRYFNETWTLLDKADRTADDDDRMVHMAHASAFHWLQAGTVVNRIRSHWQCSRVYAVLRRGEPAIWHGRRALDLAEQNSIGDWDLAFCYEALARGYWVAGDSDETRRWLEAATAAAADIAEDEDRELVLADLATISG